MATDDIRYSSTHITEAGRRAVGTAIRELLDMRNFLALQLTEATGGITAEQFDELANGYYRVPRTLAQAQEMVASLLEVGDLDVDEEELSVVLGCTLVDATTIVDKMSRASVSGPFHQYRQLGGKEGDDSGHLG